MQHYCFWFCYNKITVLTGNFAPPVSKAVIAMFLDIPHISNKTVPALTFAAQWDTAPLPLPIRTSIGFAVIGIDGNTRIQSFPFRFSFLTIACRAASIWRDEIVPDFAAFSPMFPNFSLLERKSSFDSFPFCIFLYLVFFGCSNINFLWRFHMFKLLLQMYR